MAKSMNFLDQAGEAVWRKEFAQREALGGGLYFHRPRARVMDAWRRGHSFEQLDDGHIFWRKSQALAELVPRLDQEVCAMCHVKLFAECPRQHHESGQDGGEGHPESVGGRFPRPLGKA